MKKIIAFLLVLLMTLSCAVALSSCDKRSNDKDNEKTEEKTEETPTPELDADKLVANLEKAGYTVRYEEEEYLPEGCYVHIRCNKELENYYFDSFLIYYFDNSEDASEWYNVGKDDLNESIEVIKERINEYKEELGKSVPGSEYQNDLKEGIASYEAMLEIYQSYIIGKTDNCVWMGTSKAISDTRG